MKILMTKLYDLLNKMTSRLTERQLLLVLSIVVGIVVALAGHLLKESIHFVQHLVTNWGNIANVNYLYLIFPMVGIALTVLFVRYVVRDNISHGVTRIFYAISRSESRIKPHNCYTSIVSSATTIGFGGSVGAEAPIVLTGAAIGSNIGQFMQLKYNYITLLLGCGACAAIAAVYKAPIAGFAFVLEVLMLELTFTSVVPLLISAVTAATMTYILVGVEPFFGNLQPHFSLQNLPYYAILGIVGGVMSYYFSTTTMKLEALMGRIKNQYFKVIIGGVLLGGLIFVFPPLYGEGYNTITQLLYNNWGSIFDHSMFYNIQGNFGTLALYVFGILMFKVIASTLTNASGGVGGTFAPSLFVGAMLGFFFALAINQMFGTNLPIGSFTLVGMAAVMGGVMKSPITSMFLVAELTGGFQLFLPLMLTSAISFAVSYYFEPYSIYTKRLAARGELLTHNKDENTMQFMRTQELIESDFTSVPHDARLVDLIRIVESCRRNLFPVLDKGKLVGVVTLDDIRADMFDTSKWTATSVSEYMSRPAERIYTDEEARVVVEKFERSRAWNLPVVDRQNNYIGFISKSRLMTAYREQLQSLTEE